MFCSLSALTFKEEACDVSDGDDYNSNEDGDDDSGGGGSIDIWMDT